MERPIRQKDRRVVMCLFCQAHTPIPELRSQAEVRVCIVRCHRCGKEAPYPAAAISTAEEAPDIEGLMYGLREEDFT
jgi:hypothetical protein